MKVGDKVILVYTNHYGNTKCIKEITGETPKYWKIDDDMFSKETLHKKGYDYAYINEYDASEMEKYERDRKVRTYRQVFRYVDIHISECMTEEEVLEFAYMFIKLRKKYGNETL